MKTITIEVNSGQRVSEVSSYLGAGEVVQVHQVRIIQNNLKSKSCLVTLEAQLPCKFPSFHMAVKVGKEILGVFRTGFPIYFCTSWV